MVIWNTQKQLMITTSSYGGLQTIISKTPTWNISLDHCHSLLCCLKKAYYQVLFYFVVVVFGLGGDGFTCLVRTNKYHFLQASVVNFSMLMQVTILGRLVNTS